VVVQTWLPGEAPDMLDDPTLDALLSLVERQHDPDLAPGGWDVSWWLAAVLFDGWERWWDRSLDAAPETAMRLRSFLEPVWGHRLPVEDVAHGDLNLSNVLVRGGAITGVVDWDAVGSGSRAVDLGSLLLGWQRLRLAGRAAPEGGGRLVDRIVEISGDASLRCVIAYGAVARLALTAQRGQAGELEAWRQTTDALLDLLA
jgi:aminoglycoside phosphotransferase (APT) family kinase protein